MFAVPGWSLSADKLKQETTNKPESTPTAAQPNGAGPSSDSASKKRKRPIGANSTTTNVTTENVANLWSKVIEKRGDEKPDRKKKDRPAKDSTSSSATAPPSKKAKRDKTNGPTDPAKEKKTGAKVEAPTPVVDEEQLKLERIAKKQKKKEEKMKRREERRQLEGPKEDEKAAKPAQKKTAKLTTTATTSALAAAVPAPAALTPLQASMRAKLVSARFRHLNETLYTSPSKEALRLFSESPDMFQAYHEGFRQQVSVWPENPVDGYIALVKARAGGKAKAGRGDRAGDSLPRSRDRKGGAPICRIADVGCGDAALSASLTPMSHRLGVEIKSFDLHADPSNPFMTAAADAADLPLANNSMDVVVFCLALMGTNWLAFVEEAYRVLRWKGELWVAEIKSRFAGAAELRMRIKAKGPVAHSVGSRRKMKQLGQGKKGKSGDDELEADPETVAAAVAQVDGLDDGGMSTDVSAFVRALRRRGFVLDDNRELTDENAASKPPAVDMSNKMFVRMRFVKAEQPDVGKEAVNPVRSGDNFRKKPRFLDDDDEGQRKPGADPMDDPALEAKILKPCVYKLR